jgi:signal transduction histidine kinase/CheY-like chemotaxis protein
MAGPVMPGFLLVNQTALIAAYGLSAWVLFEQFRRGRSLPLLLAGAGTLFTAAIVSLQILSVPNGLAPGRILGAGPETTTWLWTFWHIGPPVCALLYALSLRGGAPYVFAPERVRGVAWLAVLLALTIAGLASAVATLGLPWLPQQVSGDDYTALTTSGVGPALQALTVLALALLWRATRGRRTVLELWLAVGLALLVLDNLLTMAGSARGTIGWQAGRIGALVSAFAVLWAFLREAEALRVRAEQTAAELVRKDTALREAQKLEAVGRLTGGIAHDFNNLLMVMTSGLEMIRRRPEDRARVILTADAALEAAERGARLTRQLLTFARKRDLKPETVNANALLYDVEALIRRALGEAGQLRLQLDPALRPALLDRTEFETAVLNLVVNARDALTAGGGVVTVATRNLPDGRMQVSVADNGAGMDEATLHQACEPFFTTKEFGKGSGLGLAQVYGFASAAGGELELKSEPGRGTTAAITLPCVVATACRAEPANDASGALRPARPGEVVLAVEDEPAVLAATVESLSDLGYLVHPAHDARGALDLLRTEARVDLLFSDVVMPGGMNGVQLAVEARRLRPDLRVVLTSGYTNEALQGQYQVPEDVPVLAKPYRREELVRLLRRA